MTVTFHTGVSGGNGATSSTTTVAVDLSSGVVGDLAALLLVGNSNTVTASTPAGWTLAGGPYDNGAGLRTYVFQKFLAAGDISGGVSFVWSGASRTVVAGALIAGADTVTPLGVPQASANNATTAPTVSVDAGAVVLELCASGISSGATPVTSFTGRATDAEATTTIASGANRRAMVAHIAAPTSGIYGGDALVNGYPTSSVDTIITIAVNAAADSGAIPTADAGEDMLAVEPYTAVTLDGSSSSDPNNSPLTYTWVQTGGPTVTLGGSGAIRTFTAPATLDGATLAFQLTVDNGVNTSMPDGIQMQIISHTFWQITNTGVAAPDRPVSLTII